MVGQIRIEEVETRRGVSTIIQSMLPKVSISATVGQKILLIDDDPVFCRIVSKLCKLNGIACTSHTSLNQLDTVDLSEYTGAILDVHLGLANGIEVADYIRSIEPDMPLLMVSTSRYQTQKHGLDGLPFIHKSQGPQAIIDAAISTITNRN